MTQNDVRRMFLKCLVELFEHDPLRDILATSLQRMFQRRIYGTESLPIPVLRLGPENRQRAKGSVQPWFSLCVDIASSSKLNSNNRLKILTAT